MFSNKGTSGGLALGFAPQPQPTNSPMDTASLSSCNLQQQPFTFFSNNNPNLSLSPGVTPLGYSTVAAAANTPAPTFNWTGTTPVFGNANNNATSLTPAAATISPPTSPFNFSTPKIPKSASPSPSPFAFQPQQGQGQTQQLNAIIEQQAYIIQLLLEKLYQYEMVLMQIQNHGQFFTASPQLPLHPHGVIQQPCFQCSGGRASTLALQCLQMAGTDQQRAYSNKKDITPVVWRARDHYPIRELPSDSQLLTPKRKSGLTCLVDPYDKERHYKTPQLRPLILDDRNETRRRSLKSKENEHPGYSTWDHMEPPLKTIFRSDQRANDRANRYLSSLSKSKMSAECVYPSSDRERDLKWKVLDERAVKESNANIRKRQFSKARGETCLWELSDDGLSSNNQRIHTRNNYARDREPQTMWNWMRTGCCTGPPLKSHLDDDDYRRYEILKENVAGIGLPEVVANLPRRMNCSIQRDTIMKPCQSSSHRVMRKEIKTLYTHWQSQNTPSISSISLEEKTSPVFLSRGLKSCLKKSSASISPVNSGITTDKAREDDVICVTRRFQTPKVNATSGDSHSEMGSGSRARASGVKLTGEGYYCVPDLAGLDQMTSRSGSCIVKEFEVGHHEYGNVVFAGFANVANLDLNKIIEFSDRSLVLYPDEEDRPPYGQALNRCCTVTLYNVWPKEKRTLEFIRDIQRIYGMGFVDLLRDICDGFEGEFLNYCAKKGTWKFMVLTDKNRTH